VFINVFGGILRCDRLAAGLIAAVQKLGVRMPIVVRMEGTNVELGRKMLADSGLNFTSAADMGDGAQKASPSRGGGPVTLHLPTGSGLTLVSARRRRPTGYQLYEVKA
jgi:succinyl-CoA synthetase beta subunit